MLNQSPVSEFIPFSHSLELAHHIRYVRFDGLYYVTLLGPAPQKLVAQSRFFARVTDADPRGVMGTLEISTEQAAELGFVLGTEVSGNDDIVSIAQ